VYSLPDHSQIRTPDGAFIPVSDENADYINLRDAGVKVAGYGPPALVPPRSVAIWRACTIMKGTPREGRTLFDAVKAFIAGMTDPL